MKKIITVAIISVLFCAGCASVGEIQSNENATFIKVECRNEKSVQQYVMQVLRSAKARDIEFSRDGISLNIKAAYLDMDTPASKIGDILHDLQETPGVFEVQVGRNVRPVRQIF